MTRTDAVSKGNSLLGMRDRAEVAVEEEIYKYWFPPRTSPAPPRSFAASLEVQNLRRPYPHADRLGVFMCTCVRG